MSLYILIQNSLDEFKHVAFPKKKGNAKTRRGPGRFSSMFLLSLGILSACLGLKGFLLPNHFIDGGVTGISMLISFLSGIPLPLLIVLINIPFVILGYRQIGFVFALKTTLAVLGLGFSLWLIEFPDITHDKLLVAVFGGFFLGAGIGLAIRGGGVLDGTEVLALAISRKAGMSVGDIILLFNILIFSAAAYLLDFERAMYSTLTYLSASKTIDFVIHGLEEYTGVTIVSDRSEEIRRIIIYQMGGGVTLLKGKRGYGSHGDKNHDMDVIYTVITRLEINKLKGLVELIDPQAFMVMHSINDTKGGMIRKNPLHRLNKA
ncbi:MAG: YitT family protein [Bacteroidetes bacterium]|nr:YitT family protein [Bacteroidota bacterium]MBL0065361.1 YitT family protein [Bacteroidota bacterium]MBL0138145.1 YitT family protein [Bacteroidota bacterium]